MRAICPTCDTAYTIPDERIGAAGRKVRCTRCGGSWKVMRPVAEAVPSESPDEADAMAAAQAAADAAFADIPADDPPPPPATPSFDHVVARAEPPPEPVEAVPEIETVPDISVPTTEAPVAPTVKIRAEARSARRAFAMPRMPKMPRILKMPEMPEMPVAFTRAAPFFGPLLFVSAILVISGLAVFRNAIATTVPGLAGFYATLGLEVNVRGLTFGSVETLREIDNGQPVLVVEGTLSNPTQKPRDVPALRFALRDGDAQELYAWSIDPKATTIAAGDNLRFRTRLVAPPDRAADLQVRFVERRNQQARLP